MAKRDANGDIVGTTVVSGQAAVQVKDEGTVLGTSGTVDEINFVGDGVTASRSGNAVTVLIENAPAASTGTYLISGGGVAWVTGLQFSVSPATYVIQGTQYSSAAASITLDAADGTNPRIDVIGVNSSGAVIKVTGTPSANPEKPDVDPATQLELTFVYVPAGATSPNVTTYVVYRENVEWTTSRSGTTFTLASTNNPYAGTVCVEGTAVATGNYVQFQAPATFDPNTRDSLVFFIRSKATWDATRQLNLTLRQSGTQRGSTVAFKHGTYGFDSSNTTTYQQIVIPVSAFGAGGLVVNQLRMTLGGTGATIGCYIDNVEFQSGLAPDASSERMRWRGDWASTIAYVPNDVVLYSGIQYVCTTANTNQTPSLSSTFWQDTSGGGGGVSDGDKGDVTVSGSGATWTIDNGAVTLAKMANMNTAKLLGRSTAGSGAPEEISVGSGLSLSAGTLTATGGGGGGGGGGSGPSGGTILYECDFLPGEADIGSSAGGAQSLHVFASNGGVYAFATVVDAARPGVLRLSSGSAAVNGVCAIGFTQSINDTSRSSYVLDGSDLVLDFLMRVTDVSITTAYWHVGLVDDVDTYNNQVRAYLRAGAVVIESGAAGVNSFTAFAVEPAANTWFHLQLRCSSSSIRAYVDGVLQATHTTNIPTVGMFPIMQVGNNGTNANISMDIDFVRVSKTLTTNRAPTLLPIGGASSPANPINDGAYVFRNASAQSITHNTVTAVTFDTEAADDGDYANLGTNNDRLTVTNSGWYSITGWVSFPPNGTGYRNLWIYKNGLPNADRYGWVAAPGYAANSTRLQAHAEVYLAAGEYVQLAVVQDSGGSLSLDLGNKLQSFSIHRLGTPPNAMVAPATMLFETDFLPGSFVSSATPGAGTIHTQTGAGSTVTFNAATADRPGVMTIAPGTSNSSAAVIAGFTDNVNAPNYLYTLPATDDLIIDYLVKVSSVSVTNAFWIFGLVDEADTYANYVRVVLDAGVVKLQTAKTGTGAGTTATNFTTEPTAGAWCHIRLRLNTSSCRAYLDGVLQATITATIPTVGMFPVFQAGNNAGTPGITVDFDYVRISRTFSTPRSSTL